MPTPSYPLGSPEWLDHVFSTPPVRGLKGRSKRNRSHDYPSAHMGRTIIVEGRNEECAATVLEYFCTLGLVRRFKEQPFRADVDEFDYEIVPDFLVEAADGQLFIVEVKTDRFITVRAEHVFNRTRAKFADFGITYLVWSDRTPLTHALRRSIRETKRLSKSVDGEEILELQQKVAAQSSISVKELYQQGFDWGVIHAAAWKGYVHFRLLDEFNFATEIASHPLLDLRAIFFGHSSPCGEWWSSLQGYGVGR